MDRLSSAYSALADPTRRAILADLTGGPKSFTELAAPYEMSKPAVVKHLRVLENAGLVARDGAKARPRYRVDPKGFDDPRRWIEEQARFWAEALDRLDAYANEIATQKGGSS
ncbi:MAG: metalloregulator ArsR/SmtB family transcription factor [Pseudomonadota bacterium]